jgi:hypothetical protein
MQVLWSRGLINASSLEQYTLDGKKSNYRQGQLTIITSPHPRQLQGLQGRRNSAGILRDSAWRTVNFTPKFHAELAGKALNIVGHIQKPSINIFNYHRREVKRISRSLFETEPALIVC